MAIGTKAIALACAGCGCGGAACLAPAEAMPGPIADARYAVVKIVENFTSKIGGNYSYGGSQWDGNSWR